MLTPKEIHPSITLERIQQALEEDRNMGFCVFCGEDAFQVEPDAHEYQCECCGRKGVYGAEELLLYIN